MEQLLNPTSIFVMQILWGIVMLLVGIVLDAIRKQMAEHSRDLKALNDKVLACYVPRSECALSSRDRWIQIETMENQIREIQVDVAAIKERLKVRRADREAE